MLRYAQNYNWYRLTRSLTYEIPLKKSAEVILLESKLDFIELCRNLEIGNIKDIYIHYYI